MRRVTIKEGSSFETINGYINVDLINEDGLCYCHQFIMDMDGNVAMDMFDTLTANDIAEYLKEIDGQDYEVIVER